MIVAPSLNEPHVVAGSAVHQPPDTSIQVRSSASCAGKESIHDRSVQSACKG